MSRTEEQFSNFVEGHFRTLLSEFPELKIAAGKNILTDVTCIFEKGKFELIHGFSQTDIVIYKEQAISTFNSDLIKFYGDKDIRNGLFAIPYVVFELKTGDLTSDAIRCRDFVAGRIRTLFPFVAYYFIAERTTKEEKTLFRQGKSFTNYFISKKLIDNDYLTRIYNSYISPHIRNLNFQLHQID